MGQWAEEVLRVKLATTYLGWTLTRGCLWQADYSHLSSCDLAVQGMLSTAEVDSRVPDRSKLREACAVAPYGRCSWLCARLDVRHGVDLQPNVRAKR